jgi:hypothetical protein
MQKEGVCRSFAFAGNALAVILRESRGIGRLLLAAREIAARARRQNERRRAVSNSSNQQDTAADSTTNRDLRAPG